MKTVDLFKTLGTRIQSLNRVVFYLAIIPMVISVIIVLADIIGRYLRHPVPASNSITALLLALIIAFGFAHTHALKGNIDVDIVVTKLPMGIRRVITIINTVLATVVVGLLAWKSWPWVMSAYNDREWVANMNWPTWPFKALMALGATLLFLQLLIECFQGVKAIISGPGANTPEISAEDKIFEDFRG